MIVVFHKMYQLHSSSLFQFYNFTLPHGFFVNLDSRTNYYIFVVLQIFLNNYEYFGRHLTLKSEIVW